MSKCVVCYTLNQMGKSKEEPRGQANYVFHGMSLCTDHFNFSMRVTRPYEAIQTWTLFCLDASAYCDEVADAKTD